MIDHSIFLRNPSATVSSVSGLLSLDSGVTQIIIDNGVSEGSFTELDVSRFSHLKSLVIGNHCFTFVNQLKMIGLGELESVEIGMNSFTQYKNWYGQDPDRHFYLKNCPKLKSLKMGRYSFSDYTVIEIENVDALESIEMGNAINLNEASLNFDYASLELKSILVHSE